MSVASTINDKSNITPVRPPRKKKNSTSSSIISENDNSLDVNIQNVFSYNNFLIIIFQIPDTQPLLHNDRRSSPKKSMKTRRAPKSPDDFDAILPYEEPVKINDNKHEEVTEIKPKSFSDQLNTFMSNQQKQLTAEIKQVMSEGTSLGLKQVSNIRKLEEENSLRKKENSGDILTKVTIPRSGSFLNAGLTRYKSKVIRYENLLRILNWNELSSR